ncbi:hypothetical protein [Streptomyces sp. A1136]|uniref:hypothetical protein n=1 Tax=Streptomyces sp. A1136 TaxID=2563102 RepID=UPI00109E8135|nr:hypothetical protein [Streptomyces sp. A1136]THA46688.1 hypothetical protein E6R62_33070 [Streptomyces sp. A1136]
MGTPPRTAVRNGAAALLWVLALAGCATSAPRPSAAPPSPSPSSPAQICTSLVSYWAEETLKGGKWAGLDWEQKGLSNEQYAIHEDAVAAGRAEERTAGLDKALEVVDRVVAQRCAAQNGATWSSENWRPPSADTRSPE